MIAPHPRTFTAVIQRAHYVIPAEAGASAGGTPIQRGRGGRASPAHIAPLVRAPLRWNEGGVTTHLNPFF